MVRNIYKYFFSLFTIIIVELFTINFALATTKDDIKKELPSELKPWLSWVLKDYKENPCPFGFDKYGYYIFNLQNNSSQKNSSLTFNTDTCFYPTKLVIKKNDSDLSFTMNFYMYKNGKVDLVGDIQNWPSDVMEDEKKIPVFAQGDIPNIVLKKGEHKITGKLKLSQELSLPSSVAVVNLKDVSGKDEFVNIINGKLQLKNEIQRELNNSKKDLNKVAETKKENTIRIKVFRELTDEIPFKMRTLLEMVISGEERDINLGKIIYEGSYLYNLKSTLPVKTDDDKNFIFHFKHPGTYTFTADTVFKDIKNNFKFFKSSNDFPKHEIWIYHNNESVRATKIDESVKSVDPTYLEFPKDFNHHLAKTSRVIYYKINEGDDFKIQEIKRTPNNINVQTQHLKSIRHIWINFDGNGYISNDVLMGDFNKNQFLPISDDVELKGVKVNNETVPIIVSDDNKEVGISIEKGVSREVNSETTGNDITNIPLVPWKTKTSSSLVNFELPVGWSLFHVTGIENDAFNNHGKTWIGSWNLLNIFYSIFLVAIIIKLFSFKQGALSFLCIVLFQNNQADINVSFWLFIIVITKFLANLLKDISQKTSTILNKSSEILLKLFILLIVIFSFFDIKNAIYPMLTYSLDGGKNIYPISALSGLVCWGIIGAFIYYLTKSVKNFIHKIIKKICPQTNSMWRNGCLFLIFALVFIGLFTSRSMVGTFFNADLSTDDYSYERNERGHKKATMLERGMMVIPFTTKGVAVMEDGIEEPNELIPQYANTATGVGTPRWHGARNNVSRISFRTDNLSSHKNKIHCYFLTKNMNIAISLIRFFVFIWLALLMLNKKFSMKNVFKKREFPVCIFVLCMLFGTNESFAESLGDNSFSSNIRPIVNSVPSDAILNELKTYAISKIEKMPKCTENCTSLSKLVMDEKKSSIVLNLTVNTQENGLIPVFIVDEKNPIKNIQVDKQEVHQALKTNDGTVSLYLEKGVHDVSIEIYVRKNGNNEDISFKFPSKVIAVESRLLSFDLLSNLSGVETISIQLKNQIKDDVVNIQDTENDTVKENQVETQVFVSSYYEVKKEISLSHEYKIKTIISRLGDLQKRGYVEIDLLPSEMVISKDVKVKDGKYRVLFDSFQDEKVVWSTIPAVDKIHLVATKNDLVFENWEVRGSNLYKISYQGILPVNKGTFDIWTPRQGEELFINIENVNLKKDVPLNTITSSSTEYEFVDKKKLKIKLSLNIRSAKGGIYEIKLPKEINKKKIYVLLDGNNQFFEVKDDILPLNLKQGEQEVQVGMEVKNDVSSFLTLPQIDLKPSSINATVVVKNMHKRWLLFFKGIELGPVIMYWVYFPIMLIIAFVLTRLVWVKVKFYQWMLLFIGLSFTCPINVLIIIMWFVFGYSICRYKNNPRIKKAFASFITYSVFAFLMFLYSIKNGFLGYLPTMWVSGFNSYAHGDRSTLYWYKDIISGLTPKITIISIDPIWYRIMIITWSILISIFLIRQASFMGREILAKIKEEANKEIKEEQIEK